MDYGKAKFYTETEFFPEKFIIFDYFIYTATNNFLNQFYEIIFHMSGTMLRGGGGEK